MATISFILEHKLFAFVIMVLNILIIQALYTKITILLNRNVNDAKADRGGKQTFRKIKERINDTINNLERSEKKLDFYERAKRHVRRAGFRGKYAAVIYLFLKWIAPFLFAAVAFIHNYPDFKRPIIVAVLMFLFVEYAIWSGRMEMSRKFKNSVYRIYKYLNNQISSGVPIREAIASVYEIVSDKEISALLLKMGSLYIQLNDIDLALDDFKSNFNLQEADALAVAIKQGIDTGDNSNILERQERTMFKKYINHIQAETKAQSNFVIASALCFLSIIVIMIAIPMYNDTIDGLSKIFITP